MMQDINNTDILCGGDNTLYYELTVFLAVQSVQAYKSLQTIVSFIISHSPSSCVVLLWLRVNAR